MKLIIKESVPYKNCFKIIKEYDLDNNYINFSINDILKQKKCTFGNLSLLNKNNVLPIIDFYYNKYNILEFYKDILDIPISDFEEYNIPLGKNIELVLVEEMGSTSGFGDLFLQFYNTIVTFASTNPISFSIIMDLSLTGFKKIAKKLLFYIETKCTFNTFKRALYHRKELTEKDVYKSFQLKNISANEKDTEAVICIILEYLGYEYNDKIKKWILNEKKKK